jgi:hypothetical protein
VTESGAAARYINHACGETANLRVEEFPAYAKWGEETMEGKTVPHRVRTRAPK